MKRSTWLLVATFAIMVVSMSGFAQAQDSPAKIVAPRSTVGSVQGVAVRTPLYIVKPDSGILPENSYPSGAETPGSLACIYGVSAPVSGCPRNGSNQATGGTKAIAVIEYGHNSTVQADFNAFNTYFGLPTQTLQIICACGTCPSNNGTGWDAETALDTQWAHAMAANAQIIVAEFCNDPLTDGAETQAAAAVATAGGGEVSNSWEYAGGEFSGELQLDSYFTTSSVVYFASSGTSYPSVSPNVVSAGGTTIIRDSNGNFTGEEDCWAGGGISAYEPLPNYQLIIGNKTGPHRGTSDWAADADPSTGVGVYSTTYCGGWCQVGGTSVSSPLLAGIVNEAGSFANHTASELTKTYNWYRNPGLYHTYFYDVTKGAPAGPGWDTCTGLGAPRKLAGF